MAKRPDFSKPHLVELPTIGDGEVGYITVGQGNSQVPFAIKRAFWTYATPDHIVRGRHAHHQTEQVLVAMAGRIVVMTELANGELMTFRLERPDVGIYIPPNAWHTMQYSRDAVQLVLASTDFEAEDYIYSHSEFKRIWA
ncbi:sugar 3,4-ketoisomerase [Hymenobacter sp. BT491]|uniref:sugar 3,4-ketoisomerase n=1 Tax=Hymenobacter sp. BT491 TaxID=2766779 RepID=UPI0016538432|nr:FdtA/QdtA family cupin domain-containing protein [Hymenobacter sp. BT491]MBC6988281.1 FdtA/QdtA family cupin domain-containing protein [Hymenobacter sp. BT491]